MTPFLLKYLEQRRQDMIKQNIQAIRNGHWGLSGVSIRNKLLIHGGDITSK